MGYAGEDSPKAVFPSVVGVMYSTGKDKEVGRSSAAGLGEEQELETSENHKEKEDRDKASRRYFVGTSSLTFRRDYMELENPLTDGLVSNWDLVDRLLDHGFRKRLGVEPKHHPVLLAEATFNTRQLREAATELLFEKYQVPAMFVAKNAVLAAFSAGRGSAMVLDSGGGITCAVAVHDGYALTKSIFKSTLAGDALTRELYGMYEQKGVTIKPQYCFERKVVGQGFKVTELDFPNITKSYHTYMTYEVVRDLKESSCRVSESTFDENASTTIPTVQYELPDGRVLEVGPERFKVPELMFDPKGWDPTGGTVGAHQMVYNSISASDPDIRKELYAAIILTGGNTLLPGFSDRFNRELTLIAPQRFKMIATNFAVERKFGVWIGGSILGSLGTFNQMWMSKAEFEEHGSSIVERKCP
jgi:actin-like protein 6A